MIDFDFVSPTKIYFGKGKEKMIGSILKENGAKNVLFVMGSGSIKTNGLFDTVVNSLKENNINFFLLEGVRINPTIQMVNQGIKIAKENNVDYILAVGGGSVIDTAKSIGVGYYYDGDPFDFNMFIAKPKKTLPVGVILTISAAGSELSNSCVIQNDETKQKRGFNSDVIRPVFVIENPELTYSVSAHQTACGIVDILMHTLERYMMPSAEEEPCDGFAETVMKNVISAGKKVMKNPYDYEARANLMLMSSLSHNGLTGIGKKTQLTVHALEHIVSGCYPQVVHAEGLSILWPAWAKYYIYYDYKKLDLLAKNVFNSHLKDPFANAQKAIDKICKFFKSINMPLTFRDLGMENIDIELLAETFGEEGTRKVAHHTKPMDQEVARIIYKSCL